MKINENISRRNFLKGSAIVPFTMLTESLNAAALSFSTTKTTYSSTEKITINYNNVPIANNNWVAIYNKQDSNVWANVIAWRWVKKANDTNFIITQGLPQGDYETRLFLNNSYTVEARSSFTVQNILNFSTTKTNYLPTEKIAINYSNVPKNKKNWVAIYNKLDSNVWANVIAWKWVKQSNDINFIITQGLPAGDYEARLFLKNSYNLEAKSAFTVSSINKPLEPILSNPVDQPKFSQATPNALDPSLLMSGHLNLKALKRAQTHDIVAAQYNHSTGLLSPNGLPLLTPMWGYGKTRASVSWPGKTIETFSNRKVAITWRNKLIKQGNVLPHLLPLDTSFHWAYGIHGYKQYTVEKDGVPLVPHVHGAHVNTSSDGNPEYFFSPNWKIKGPRWVQKRYKYDNSQQAGCLWYHDHSLGMTRLNVYAGLVGFYIIRDNDDTGRHNNPIGLPAQQYELAYAIQDKMFKETGELFFPANPGDPEYDGFINGENAVLPPSQFPNGGPTILPEFFGDHIVVNGKIWPKTDVEPRNYRMRLLNGCDSRFLAIRFRIASSNTSTDLIGASQPIPFTVIGGDQGLAQAATTVTSLLLNPADRADIVVNFANVPKGSRIIMENIAGDAPFDGTLTTDPEFDIANVFANRQTDRIMAFDISVPHSNIVDNFVPSKIAHYTGNQNSVDKVRKLALFEGRDEFNRLQPMLGVAEPTVDVEGNLVNGATTWHMPITENPALGSTEIWEIHNTTVDAHPVHVHLVNFEILNREKFTATKIMKTMTQHNGTTGKGFYIENIQLTPNTFTPALAVERAPKDMVTCYPGEITRIKMTFDKPGRYVWHCHILSHEDHDMMRPLHVGPMV